MYDLISPNEKEMMMAYIKNYVRTPKASFEHLFRCWANAKQDLAQLFGNKLIVSKEVEYTEATSQTIKKFNHLRYDDNRFGQLNKTFCNWYTGQFFNQFKHLCVFNTDTVRAENAVPYTFSLPIGDSKEIKFQEGMKLMKAFKKLNDAFHFWSDEDYEYFRNACSQATNQKKLTGTMAFSIHPLDYMTMSDNENGWSSCMSWKGDGCYRMGTVEMMNSPMVVVAYLSDKDMAMDPAGSKWNSKKWRQLFIVNRDMIVSIKAYPYQNNKLTKMAIKTLAEMGEKNWGIKYRTNELIEFSDDYPDDWGIDFETGFMYNDFTTTTHFAALAENYEKSPNYSCVNYSGETECMLCGEIDIDSFYDGGEADFLACEDCESHYYCMTCDTPIRDTYWLDDECYCEDCYNEYAVRTWDDYRSFHDRRNCFKYDVYDENDHFMKSIYYYRSWNSEPFKDKYLTTKEFNDQCFNIHDLKPEYREKLDNYTA